MTIDAGWKQRIVSGHALDAVKVANSERIMPPFTLPQPGLPFAPRALRTELISQLEQDPAAVDADDVRARFLTGVQRGGGHDMLPFTGQSAELIHDIPAAAELMTRLAADAEAALRGAASHVSPGG
jgi:nitronate monooxygenase/enoyl-[acyl-carrier protein] reductase II